MKKLFIFIPAFIIAGLFFAAPFIIKVNVECKSQFGDCPKEIESSLQNVNSKSLFFAKNNMGKILQNNFLLTDYSTQFKLPNILEVNILIRKPDFALFDKNTSEIWLVDETGLVLVKTNESTLPKVITEGKIPQAGRKVDGQTLTALRLMQGVWNMYQIGSGEEGGGSLVVDLPGKINVIFPLDADPQISLGALRLIYTKITTGDMSGKYFQIDLRFKNPVLR